MKGQSLLSLVFDYDVLVGRGPPFVPMRTVEIDQSDSEAISDESPVVLRGLSSREGWNKEQFTLKFFQEHSYSQEIVCYDQENHEYPMTISNFQESIREARENRSMDDVLYGKDLPCPKEWRDTLLSGLIPASHRQFGNTDLNSFLGESAPENMLVYIGHNGTRTPMHWDVCAAHALNVMVQAEKGSSSTWLVIKPEDGPKLEKLLLSINVNPQHESVLVCPDDLGCADFPIYVAKQTPGDLVCIPAMCYHQVMNMGDTTIKVAWNKITPKSLELGLREVIPLYRKIFRAEVFDVKLTAKAALEGFTAILNGENHRKEFSTDSILSSFTSVLKLFEDILLDEWINFDSLKSDRKVIIQGGTEFTPPSSSVTGLAKSTQCDFCHGSIFNRHLVCFGCKLDMSEYIICLECFALGRGCKHRSSSIQLVEIYSMKSLCRTYDEAIVAWNSASLSGRPVDQNLRNNWRERSTSQGEPHSSASLAYIRLLQLRQKLNSVPRYTCHRCSKNSKNLLTIPCSYIAESKSKWRKNEEGVKCRLHFCENCLFNCGIIWSEIVRDLKVEFVCPRCSADCDCSRCKNPPRQRPIVVESYGYSGEPSVDIRNMGAVSDCFPISKLFLKVYKKRSLEEAEAENDHDEQQISKKRLMERLERLEKELLEVKEQIRLL